VKKCFIVTFGWNENVVINLTVRFSIGPEDRFILILPRETDDPRARRAINTLEGFFDKHFPRAELEKKYVTIRNFHEGMMSILDTMMHVANTGYDVYVNVSGGMRILGLMAYTATLIARELAKGNISLVDLEIEGSHEYVPLQFPPLSMPELREGETVILETLFQHGKMTVDELIKKLGKSKSTIYRNIRDLEKLGMIKTIKVERKTYVEITKTGETYLEILAKYVPRETLEKS